MPIQVSQIARRAGLVLNDEDHVRWTLPELMDWMNDAAGEIVIRQPSSHSVIEGVDLVDGALQQLPAGGIVVMDVVRNLPGRPISRVSRRLLDDQFPDWYAAKPTDRIKHYTLEEETPRHFYVYPPAKAGARVEVKFSTAPPIVADVSDEIQLDRQYIGPILSYVLYRSLAKDSEYANGTIAAAHFQAFNEAMGVNNESTSNVARSAGQQ
jgi:hypothetical protein